MPNPVNVFLAYDHRDAKWAKEVVNYLNILSRQGLVTIWDNGQLLPGMNWRDEVTKHLANAQVVLCLVSPDFLSSDIADEIIKQALQKREQTDRAVVPILIRPVDWRQSPLGSLVALPRNGRPLAAWGNRAVALLEITQEIKQLILAQRVGEAPMSEPLLEYGEEQEREARDPISRIRSSIFPKFSPEDRVKLQEQLERAESSLRSSYTYIQGYENTLRILSDQAEKDGVRQAAEKQRILAKHYFTEYIQTANQLGIRVPAEIAQMFRYIDDPGFQTTF